MAPNKKYKKLTPICGAAVEMGCIIFLFYANLLMGEFTHANGEGKTLLFAVKDIITVTNFGIAIIASLIGYVFFEYLRKKI